MDLSPILRSGQKSGSARAGSGRRCSWFRSRSRLALLAVLIAQSLSQAAQATDWRYCYAGSDPDHRFYASRPFAASKPMEAIEQQWLAWLGRQGITFETTGCPRGADRAGLEASLKSAARYNEGIGRRTVDLGWTPDP